MKHKALKVGLMPVAGHLSFGVLMLVVDVVHGINDQDFSFALSLLFYYANYSGVVLLDYMNADCNILTIILAGLGQWIVIGAVAGGVTALICWKKGRKL